MDKQKIIEFREGLIKKFENQKIKVNTRILRELFGKAT